jgi:hypothetical protein
MGFDIALQDERGKVIEQLSDPKNFLHRVLERAIADDHLLEEIDWNGDTTFNRFQMPRFLSEWELVAKHCESTDETELVKKVRGLAERCKESVHLYLKFIGD